MPRELLHAAFSRLRTSRIGLRVLAFNLLLVFLPVAGILYLDVYEAQLLETQERGMVQQARVLAAALGGVRALGASAADAVFGAGAGAAAGALDSFSVSSRSCRSSCSMRPSSCRCRS